MTQVNVLLSEDQNNFIAEKVAAGEYADASEVVQQALRTLAETEREDQEKLIELRAALDAGDASVVAEGDVFARARERIGLNPRPTR